MANFYLTGNKLVVIREVYNPVTQDIESTELYKGYEGGVSSFLSNYQPHEALLLNHLKVVEHHQFGVRERYAIEWDRDFMSAVAARLFRRWETKEEEEASRYMQSLEDNVFHF